MIQLEQIQAQTEILLNLETMVVVLTSLESDIILEEVNQLRVEYLKVRINLILIRNQIQLLIPNLIVIHPLKLKAQHLQSL